MGKAPSGRRQDAAADAVGSGAAPGGAGAPPSNTAPHNCKWVDDLVILRSGVDTLQLSFRGELYQDAQIRLSELKVLAQSSDKGEQAFAQMELDGELFSVLPRGSGRFVFTLVNPCFRISLSDGKGAMPVAFVQVQSELLTKSGHRFALQRLKPIISQLASISESPSISRMDICVDFSTWFDMESISRHHWVTRAKRISQYVEANRFTGWSIGLKGSVACRLYDKTAEILVTDKLYMQGLWIDCGWDGSTPVWRLEFEVKREALRQYEAGEIEDLEILAAGLWSHLTHSWLRLTIPSEGDETRSRWDTHPLWRSLSTVDFGALDVPALQRVRNTNPPSRDWMFRSAGSGIIAFMALEDIQEFREGCRQYAEAYLAYLDEYQDFRGCSSEEFIRSRVRAYCRKHNLRLNQRGPYEHDPLASAMTRRYRQGKDGE